MLYTFPTLILLPGIQVIKGTVLNIKELNNDSALTIIKKQWRKMYS